MQLFTKKNYRFGEVVSAFQKAIRRGDEDVAMYMAVELFNSGFEGYLLRRIRIITSEDIGLAEPNMPILIDALQRSYEELKAENKPGRPERMFLTHMVIAMCRAKKSRLIDYKLIIGWRTHNDHKMEIPDYAFDKHTQKGKSMGRGIDHFFDEASKINNEELQPGEKEAKKKAKELLIKNPNPLTFEKVKRGSRTEMQSLFEAEEAE